MVIEITFSLFRIRKLDGGKVGIGILLQLDFDKLGQIENLHRALDESRADTVDGRVNTSGRQRILFTPSRVPQEGIKVGGVRLFHWIRHQPTLVYLRDGFQIPISRPRLEIFLNRLGYSFVMWRDNLRNRDRKWKQKKRQLGKYF